MAPPSTPAAMADARDAEAALGAWHGALEAHDWPAVDAGLAPGFLMIEHDRVMDKPTLLAMVTAGAQSGRQRARLHDFHTVVERDCAWTTLRNDELWIPHDGEPQAFSFVETAIFRRVDGAWRIERYHATRIAPVTGP